MDHNEHTPEEMQDAIQRMQRVSDAFYGPATQTGCHTFIEFCGFMNEYIQVCRTNLEMGNDFLSANTHSGKALKMRPYQAEYLAEKFDCIFGPALRSDPELKDIFLKKVFE